MRGKRVLITGATAGIGLETCRQLGQLGAELLMVGRDAAKTAAMAERVRQETKAPVHTFIADLSVMAAVRGLAEEVQRRFDRLDVLLNNVGALFAKRELTQDGFERTFATNHLSPFVLTRALWPMLTAGHPARVVTVASAAHKRGRIDFDDLMAEKRYTTMGQYSNTKLANILFNTELARRLKGTACTANCLHPGVVNSSFFHVSGWLGLFGKVGSFFMLSPEKGAKTSVYVASARELERVTGQYFVKGRPVLPSRQARDEVAAARLWEVSEQLTEPFAAA